MEILIIKTILDTIKTIKDLTSKKEEKKDNSLIESKLILLENKINQLKKETEIKEITNFNQIQIKLKTLFNAHKIEDNLIVKFIKNTIDEKFEIPISENSNLKLIFDKLTDKHIDDLSSLFGINKGWMYSQEKLYKNRNYYKDVNSFINFIIEKSKTEKLKGFAFRVEKFDYLNKELHQPLYLVIRTPICTLYNTTIYRYYPISTNWKWEYWRTRYQVKSIFNLFEDPNIYIDFNGKTVTKEELELIGDLNCCPDKVIRSKVMNTWYPYDYATLLSKNSYSNELEETESILKYIDEKGYKKHFNTAI